MEDANQQVNDNENADSQNGDQDDVLLEVEADEADAEADKADKDAAGDGDKDYKSLYEAEKARNAKLYARVKKDEKKSAPVVNSSPTLTREEAILIAKGYSDEELKVLTKLQKGAEAEGKKVTLLEAAEDEVFKAWQEKQQKAEKRSKAQLGASGGQPFREEVAKPGMTEADHRKLWEKSRSK